MQLLKKIGISLLGLVILLAFGSLFISSTLKVERSIEVGVPADAAFEQVNTLRNWEQWSPWHKIDPQMILTYSGPDGGPGSSYNWFSKHSDVGDGGFRIISTQPYKTIDAEMQFGPDNKATTHYAFDQTANGTRITWSMESEMGMNPIDKYFGIMFLDKYVGADFERGLNNMKQILEAKSVIQDDPHAGHGH